MSNIKTNVLLFVICVLSLFCALNFGICHLYAEDKPSSGDLINKSWAAHGKRNVEETFKYTQQLIDLYKDEAVRQEAGLKALPKAKNEIEDVQVLNDVATAYFIQAESLMRQDRAGEAKKIFKLIVNKYPFAQAWDPRGWFWSLKLASEQSLKKIETGSIEIEQKKKVSQLPTKIVLYDPGTEDFVNYEKYGEFIDTGTKNYKYVVTDQEGLIAAVGEGIYPNTASVRWDPEFKKAQKEKRLDGDLWDFSHSPDLEAAFLKWATCNEPQGVKLFYTGLLLEKSGLIEHALKCYYAIVVHFPASYGWTYWHTPWYVGQAALAKINYILRNNPQIGYRLEGADIKIINGYDNDVSNDVAMVSPGKFVKVGLLDKLIAKTKPGASEIRKKSGSGKVYTTQYANGDWQLMVEGKPYIIKGVTYSPTKVGQSPDEGTQTSWMLDDFNHNGKADGPYDSYLDTDAKKVPVGDFKLMKDMGVNTIRLYHHPLKIDKEVLRDMYKTYGIRVIMGDFLGKYAIGSGAAWNPGTDYKNEEQKKKMIESVKQMVNEYKDEPFILFWLLGNENVYGYACNADSEPDAFFKFANEVAKIIKSIDPEHPVAICSGDILFLDKFGKDSPDIDMFGTNAYRGNYGFGRFWKSVKEEADKPAFITEFGCPSYAEGKTTEEAQEAQADYHKASWEDIEGNMAFKSGAGNAIGAVVFEWLDEWWKAYEPSIHDTKGLWAGPFPDGFMHEEWLGLCGQGDGKDSPFLRHLRKAYYTYQKLWR
ncbi:MAG: glycoside hydrolase family 2 TIM barrel-domain containing protein [Candidatus Omnitrophica bacterium]|nr:glycoside hydrolase family 2 TIM barrel-domain containing protein [Candidatus Omnitrophota bacterium]